MREIMLVFMGFAASVYVVSVVVYVVIMLKIYKNKRKLYYNWWVLMALSLIAPIAILFNFIDEYREEWGK